MSSETPATYPVLNKIAKKLRNTPFHPQWFAFFREEKNLRLSCAHLHGVIIDIGCADGKPRHHLPADARYVGIDYLSTARGWYATRPDIFADAQSLPIENNCVDHALLLDVLEHLPRPRLALSEIHRVLRNGGTLTMQIPFMYPLHDAPLDFQRWTRHGLQQSAEETGFHVTQEMAIGHPLETAALNANIALSKTVLNWIKGRNPLAITLFTLPFAVLAINSIAWIFGALSRSDDLMPYAYRVVWTKN